MVENISNIVENINNVVDQIIKLSPAIAASVAVVIACLNEEHRKEDLRLSKKPFCIITYQRKSSVNGNGETIHYYNFEIKNPTNNLCFPIGFGDVADKKNGKISYTPLVKDQTISVNEFPDTNVHDFSTTFFYNDAIGNTYFSIISMKQISVDEPQTAEILKDDLYPKKLKNEDYLKKEDYPSWEDDFVEGLHSAWK